MSLHPEMPLQKVRIRDLEWRFRHSMVFRDQVGAQLMLGIAVSL